jgi:CelD/BcsL family acetyltransferase involved in cellulose biosynthesis
LGGGLRNKDKLSYEFRKMADQGWWRGDILFCNGDAVSFIVGYRFGQTYFAWERGYLPAWKRWSVGTVTTLELLGTLLSEVDPPNRFDFLYGDDEYKARLGTSSWEEQSFFLLKKNLPDVVVYLSLATVNMVSISVGNLLWKYKLKARLKTFVRSRALRKPSTNVLSRKFVS